MLRSLSLTQKPLDDERKVDQLALIAGNSLRSLAKAITVELMESFRSLRQMTAAEASVTGLRKKGEKSDDDFLPHKHSSCASAAVCHPFSVRNNKREASGSPLNSRASGKRN